MQSDDPKLRGFSTFLELERAARHAESVEALSFTMVNETRRLLQYRQAVLASGGGTAGLRVDYVSGVSVVERDAPFVRWVGRAMAALGGAYGGAHGEAKAAPRAVTEDDVPAELRDGWREWGAGQVLLVPLVAPDGERLGLLWLSREMPWHAGDSVLAERLADCYAHAWRALAGKRAGRRRRRWPRVLTALAVASALGALAVPVPQSALAPAEVVASKPRVVAAPMNGVIAEMHVRPNQQVASGDALFSFEASELESAVAVAERSLAIAEAELRRAAQGAFADREQTAQLRILEAKRDLRAAELAHARERLSRVTVKAEQAGVAVYTDANDWIGRPVQTGERVMQVADPRHTRLRVDLPVKDAIALEPGAKVALFLDTAPLERIPAVLESASYEARVTPGDVLAYRVLADFTGKRERPRIGLKGTAKLLGDPVPLAMYLFRRPVAAARQWLGL
ncbi:efflux RND transporter periplasmic adaptor subunit [Ferruginivarius sediminum]|uniref:HlyD family efflux transporter periplasmic adaptor subunit n=1 Tax=Ferruginivarius sediminum TaxID=2661937 RepID=A0A369TCN0_9PROT|nr:HlyD family efflux transporter periplasmic adaptor subunit [Ferruginivarius sediminum]RDD63069.1 HlyD family efflux transporter periplasmic adaptor subunit [Ferruginivarius sediminum]